VSGLFDLQGRTALITGSTRGIGLAIAERMAQAGARVVISSRKQDSCEEVAKSIRDAGGEAVAIACNISSSARAKPTGGSISWSATPP
jgi:dehydrogenase/reductase SDR family protein 4